MMFSKIIYLGVLSFQSSADCIFKSCQDSYIGDSECDIACNNNLCNFDSPNTTPNLTNFEKFQLSDCYLICNSTGCTDENLQNNICDRDCNNEFCAFDLGTCGVCSENCTESLLLNSICDDLCNSERCEFDSNHCGLCSQNCSTSECLDERCKSEDCKNIPNNPCFVQCSETCAAGWLKNNKCEAECNVLECDFDKGDCDCAPGCNDEQLKKDCEGKDDPCSNEMCKFKDWKCGDCAFGCREEMLGDGMCNVDCFNQGCQFDLQDCECSEGCIMNFENNVWRNATSNENNEFCLVPGCNYSMVNDPDKFQVRKMLLAQMFYKNFSFQNISQLPAGCTEEDLRYFDNTNNPKCGVDHPCNNEKGLWCMGRSDISTLNLDDCLRYSNESCLIFNTLMVEDKSRSDLSSCPLGYSSNNGLSQLFTSSAGGLKLCLPEISNYSESSPNTFYVLPLNYTAAKGTGTPEDPFQSLYYAMTQIYSDFSKIVLEEGSYLFEYTKVKDLFKREDEFDPLNFDSILKIYSIVIEGKNSNNPTKVIWKPTITEGTIKILKISSKAMTIYLKNIEFNGAMILKDKCELPSDFCLYCPSISVFKPNDSIFFLNDRKQIVDSDMKNQSDKCSQFSNTEVFVFYDEAIVENVVFQQFRMKFKTLIRAYQSLNLTNVNFSSIGANTGGHAIDLSCVSDCETVDFTYDQGVIEDLNSGYEMSDTIETGSFLQINTIRSIYMTKIKSLYNFLYSNSDSSNPSYFLSVVNFYGTFVISSSIFSDIIANTLFDIDVMKLKYKTLEPDNNGFSLSYNQQHFTMIDVIFENIYTSDSFFSYNMKSVTHNIRIFNISFDKVISEESSIISLDFSGTLKKKDKLGDLARTGSESAFISRREVIIDNISFCNSTTAEYLLHIKRNANVFISNVNSDSLYDGSSSDIGNIIKNFKNQGKYLSIQPATYLIDDLSCLGTIKISESYNISIQSTHISSTNCLNKEAPSGLVIENSEAYVNLSFVSLSSLNSSSSFGSGIHFNGMDHQLNLEDITLQNVINNDGSIIELNQCSNIFIRNLKFDFIVSMNSAPFKVSDLKFFDLGSFEISNTFSQYGDGGFLSLIATSKAFSYIKINDGLVSNVSAFGNGGFLQIDAINTKQQQSLVLKNLKLQSIYANDGVFLFITNKIKFFQSKISNIEVSLSSGRKSLIFDSHLNGLLIMENLLFIHNKNLETFAIRGDYQSAGNLLQVTNITVKDCSGTGEVFLLEGENTEGVVEFENVLISNISNSHSYADGFRIFSITLNINKVTLKLMNSFIYISNSAQAIVTSAKITKTFAYVADVSNQGFFSCYTCSISTNFGTIITANSESHINLMNTSITKNTSNNSQVSILSIESSGNTSNILEDTIIQDNFAEKAEMIKFTNAEVIIKNSKIQRNKVKSSVNNGIIIFNSDVLISTTYFNDQSSSKTSAFIYGLSESNISIINSTFKSGISGGDGGAINLLDCYSVSIIDCKFKDNEASFNGGAIFSKLTKLSIEKSEFDSNKGRSGSDLYLEDGPFDILESFFVDSGCLSGINCKSVHASGSSLNLWNITFVNKKKISGIYAFGFYSVNIFNSKFLNFNGSEFGALRLEGNGKNGTAFISECFFEDNHSGKYGGAIHLDNMNLIIENSTFRDNFAQIAGGALYLVTPICSNCFFNISGTNLFFKNKAGLEGGAIKWEDFKPNIGTEVVLSNNSAIYGKNLASKPAFLLITSKDIPSLSINQSITFEKIAAGQPFTKKIEVILKDCYNNSVIIDNSSHLLLESLSETLKIDGNISFISSKGSFELTGFIPWAPPDSIKKIRISTTAITSKIVKNDETIYKNDLTFSLSLRPCENGEQIEKSSCTVCSEPRFLIKPAASCKMCPTGGNCTGGDKVWVKQGYYKTHPLSEVIYECAFPDVCLGNKTGFETECLKGYSGIACAVCESGFTKTADGKCKKCESSFMTYLIMIAVLLGIIFICIVLVKSSIKSAFVLKSKHSIYIKIFTNYLQLVFLTAQFNLKWPSYAVALFGVQKSAATLTESLFSFECYFEKESQISNSEVYFSKMIFYSILPLGIFTFSIVVWMGICSMKEDYKPMKRELPLTLIVIFFLFYPNIVKFMFSNFSCTYFDMLGKYLNDNFSVKCWDSNHSKYSLIVAFPSIVVWSVGIPTLVLISMIKKRKQLYKEDNRVIYGFIFNGYKTSIFYWEFIIMYRKIIIICVIVFIVDVSEAVQGLTIALLLLFSLFIQYEVAPYNSEELNHMEIEALITASLTIYCGLYYLTQDIGEVFKIALFVIIVGGNCYFIFLWLYWMLKALIDIMVKIIPSLKLAFKKGDAFDDDFNKEEIVVDGSYYDLADGKRHYTFMKTLKTHESHFHFNSIPELFATIIMQNDEFDQHFEEEKEKINESIEIAIKDQEVTFRENTLDSQQRLEKTGNNIRSKDVTSSYTQRINEKYDFNEDERFFFRRKQEFNKRCKRKSLNSLDNVKDEDYEIKNISDNKISTLEEKKTTFITQGEKIDPRNSPKSNEEEAFVQSDRNY